MKSIYYFAYGSNLHPKRLMERVPSAELIGVTTLPKHRLLFHKRSNDGSSKCNIFNSGSESDHICGAVYKINHEHKKELDRFEGRGCGYMDIQITLVHDGNKYTCFTYLAQQSHIVDNLKPYHWYKKLVVIGARYLEFSASYIASIETVESMEDPNSKRRNEQELLIERILTSLPG